MTVAKSEFTTLVAETMPVALGYIPLGIAFGVLFGELGYAWYWPGIIGMTVFAGSAQFMSISLIKTQASLREIFVVTLLLNLRHIFYGVSFLKRYAMHGWMRPYLIFGLTDETYSLLTSLPDAKDEPDSRKDLLVTGLNHAYWTVGCLVGGIFGEIAEVKIEGLDFALTALFAVLAVEQYYASKRIELVAAAVLFAVVAAMVVPSLLLIGSLCAAAIMVMGLGFRENWK
jgi:4-azaleucine resistance transporter AzlC